MIRATLVALVAAMVVQDTTPAVVYVDPSAATLVAKGARIEKIAGGLQFVEGPVWRADDGGYLVFSDIPANELKRWDRAGGVRTFRTPSGNANGNTLDREGRVVSAEHGGRISRIEANGTVVTVVDAFQGAKLSSPNDVVVKSDGTIWFTDPTYGLGPRKQETSGNFVYRFDSRSSALTAVVRDTWYNQMAWHSRRMSRSCTWLTPGNPATSAPSPWRPTERSATAVCSRESIAAAPTASGATSSGNVWSSSGDGAQVFSPSGARLLRIVLPESGANLAFGGPGGRTLFVTARTSVYAVETLVRSSPRK